MADAARKPLAISYVGLTDKNVEQLRKLNTVLFPVRYSDKFYQIDVLKPEHADVSKLGTCSAQFEAPIHVRTDVRHRISCAFHPIRRVFLVPVCHNDVSIGAVCCRLETDAATGAKKLYIMVLGVLAPYREFGVGALCDLRVRELLSIV
jgi:hypothetical protein